MVLNDDQDASKLDFANLVCVMALGLTFPTKIAAFPFTSLRLNLCKASLRRLAILV